MSSFTTIKCEIYEEATLMETLIEMGYKISHNTKLVNNYGGSKNVNFQIELENSTNIGFYRKTGERNFNIVVDWFSVHGVNRKEFKRKLMQEYSKKIVHRQARAMGYNVKTIVNKDKTIRMVLQKR